MPQDPRTSYFSGRPVESSAQGPGDLLRGVGSLQRRVGQGIHDALPGPMQRSAQIGHQAQRFNPMGMGGGSLGFAGEEAESYLLDAFGFDSDELDMYDGAKTLASFGAMSGLGAARAMAPRLNAMGRASRVGQIRDISSAQMRNLQDGGLSLSPQTPATNVSEAFTMRPPIQRAKGEALLRQHPNQLSTKSLRPQDELRLNTPVEPQPLGGPPQGFEADAIRPRGGSSSFVSLRSQPDSMPPQRFAAGDTHIPGGGNTMPPIGGSMAGAAGGGIGLASMLAGEEANAEEMNAQNHARAKAAPPSPYSPPPAPGTSTSMSTPNLLASGGAEKVPSMTGEYGSENDNLVLSSNPDMFSPEESQAPTNSDQYEVQSGDTVSGIARALLQQAGLDPTPEEIEEMTQQILMSSPQMQGVAPEQMQVGTELGLPYAMEEATMGSIDRDTGRPGFMGTRKPVEPPLDMLASTLAEEEEPSPHMVGQNEFLPQF